jgi:hypothetical protein
MATTFVRYPYISLKFATSMRPLSASAPYLFRFMSYLADMLLCYSPCAKPKARTSSCSQGWMRDWMVSTHLECRGILPCRTRCRLQRASFTSGVMNPFCTDLPTTSKHFHSQCHKWSLVQCYTFQWIQLIFNLLIFFSCSVHINDHWNSFTIIAHLWSPALADHSHTTLEVFSSRRGTTLAGESRAF